MERIYLWGFLVIAFQSLSEGQELSEKSVLSTCSRGLPISHPEVEYYCCLLQAGSYNGSWYHGGYYLSRHMELLRTWNCPQLNDECKKRPYDFNEFTGLTYDLFCNRTSLESTCLPIVENSVPSSRRKTILNSVNTQNNVSDSSGDGDVEIHVSSVSEWRLLLNEIDFSSLSTDVSKPCFQIAQLDSSEGGYGEFHEILSTTIPFCGMTWCGFSKPVVTKGIRPYDCLPTLCKANVIIMMTLIIILSFMIIVLNIIVIAVFSTTKKLRNSQAIYKCSVAGADLLVGFFALPSFGVNLYRMTWENVAMGETVQLDNPELVKPFIDWGKVPMPGRDGITARRTTGFSVDLYNPTFGIAAGSLTAISLMVSLYSLTMAGFDRLLAVFKPLRYRPHIAKKVSIYVTLSVWVMSILFALVPTMSDLNYAISGMLFVVYGPKAEVFYIVLFAVPIVIVWVTNISIFVIVRRRRKERRLLTNSVHKPNQERNEDTRLAVTLTIIVGVFSTCCLPAAIISVVFLNYRISSSTPNPERDTIFNSVDFVAAVVLMSNSLWNYFIYSARNKDFRKASGNLWRRIQSSVKSPREDVPNSKKRENVRRNNSPNPTNLSITAITTNTLHSNSTKKTNLNKLCEGNQKKNNDADFQKSNNDDFQQKPDGKSKDGTFRSLTKALRCNKARSLDSSTAFDSRVATANDESASVGIENHGYEIPKKENA